jgi:hypothetical protein
MGTEVQDTDQRGNDSLLSPGLAPLATGRESQGPGRGSPEPTPALPLSAEGTSHPAEDDAGVFGVGALHQTLEVHLGHLDVRSAGGVTRGESAVPPERAHATRYGLLSRRGSDEGDLPTTGRPPSIQFIERSLVDRLTHIKPKTAGH